jgi:hypothetical protein
MENRSLLKKFAISVLAVLCFSCGGKTHSKLPEGYIDRPPLTEQAVFKGTASLEGWSFSDEGIEDVSVYIDRQHVASAQIGFQRADVAKAFPNEQYAKESGWRAIIDVTNLSPGPHNVVVQATSKNGAKRDIASFQALVTK